MPFSRSAATRLATPYLLAGLLVVLMAGIASGWAMQARTVARTVETSRLESLSQAFAAHVSLSLTGYIALLDRISTYVRDDRTLPESHLLSEVILQTPYLLGARVLEDGHIRTAVERPGGEGALPWPDIAEPPGKGETTIVPVSAPNVLDMRHVTQDGLVIELLVDHRALLGAMAPLIDMPGRSVGLYGQDGRVLARLPRAPGWPTTIQVPMLPHNGRLVETRLSPFDGINKLVAWTKLDGYTLLLAMTIPIEGIYAIWWHQVRLVTLAWLFLSVGIAIAAHRFARVQASTRRTTQALHRSEAELRSLFHQNLQLLAFLDCDGRLRRINETALTFIGAREEEVLGRKFWATPWWRDDPQGQAELRSSIAAVCQGEARTLNGRHTNHAGRVHIFESSLSPVLNTQGQVTGILAEGRDITARLAAERDAADQRQRLELALETTEQGIWDWNPQTNVAAYSPQLIEMLGYDPEDWPPTIESWRTRVHPNDLPRSAQSLKAHMDGVQPLYECEHRLRRKDGRWAWILAKGKVVERTANGLPLRVVGTHADVTARHENEEHLRRLAEALESSNRNLEQFAYVASHDLQEPLRMVSSYLGLLRRRKGDILDAEALDFIGYATDGAQRMSQLITDLLDYSRVTTAGRPFATVPLNAPLKEALGNLTLAIAESGATVNVPEALPVVIADAGQLLQLFQNLIGNAVKYARPDRPPHIQVDAEVRHGVCRMTVRDNGIGIEPQYRNRIFRIFQRLHGRTTFAGTGIGLAVAQRIVERHGGRIWVEDAVPSDWTEGSTFVVELPIHGPVPASATPPQARLPKEPVAS